VQSASRPFTAVFHDIVGNTEDVLRAQVKLAKLEIRSELGDIVESGVLLVTSAAFGIASVFLLMLAAALALSQEIPLWIASVAVGFSGAILAAFFGVSGMKRLRAIKLLPESTDVA
jgi:hypothetical protein